MATTKVEIDREPTAPSEADLPDLTTLHRLIRHVEPRDLTLLGPNGEAIALPASVVRALRQAVEPLARDRVVTISHTARNLTLNQVEELADIARPELLRLLDEGAVPSKTVDGLQCIRLEDALDLKAQHDAERRAILRRLAEGGQEVDALLGDFTDADDAEAATDQKTADQR